MVPIGQNIPASQKTAAVLPEGEKRNGTHGSQLHNGTGESCHGRLTQCARGDQPDKDTLPVPAASICPALKKRLLAHQKGEKEKGRAFTYVAIKQLHGKPCTKRICLPPISGTQRGDGIFCLPVFIFSA
ncbi:hypothetical protein [Ethanoligenens sp.]|uniref:hypothetical protein n=1 Tax=Ethanoligenens sp. TaxID=2099655 RepID=UPI0039EA2963